MSSKAKRKGQAQVAPKGGQKPQARAQVQAQPQTRPQTAAQPRTYDASTEDARRLQRQERNAARMAAAEKRRRMRTIRRYGIIAAIVVVLLGTFAAIYINESNKPGESTPAMASRQHIQPGQTIQYNTDPPTNGPHVGSVPQFKIYTEPITNELAVHGLEDGGVIINYRPDLDKPTVDKLAAVTTSYLELGGGRSHVILQPYPNLSHPIVLTTWRRIDRLDVFDEPRIRRFVDAYVGIDHHEGTEGKRIP